MAFTAPVTRATDFLVTAAVWNAEHVDNFNSGVMHLVNRKAADQSVTSSVVFVDCTTMTLPVAANETWMFEFDVYYFAATTGDMVLRFTFPTAGRVDANVMWENNSNTATLQGSTGTTSPTTNIALVGNGGSGRQLAPVKGIYIGGANAGNVQLQFAQATSDATSTTIFANSTVWGVKLA